MWIDTWVLRVPPRNAAQNPACEFTRIYFVHLGLALKNDEIPKIIEVVNRVSET